MKIYRVYTNMDLDIQVVDCVRKTDSYYWTDKKTRHLLDTAWVKSFDTMSDAVKHLKYLLYGRQRTLEYSLLSHNDLINNFEVRYKEILDLTPSL